MLLREDSMPIIEFAPHLRRHVDCPSQTVVQLDLRAALEEALLAAPGLRHYVLDDQGAIRAHVAVFINGERISQTDTNQPLMNDDQVYVVQALSGG